MYHGPSGPESPPRTPHGPPRLLPRRELTRVLSQSDTTRRPAAPQAPPAHPRVPGPTARPAPQKRGEPLGRALRGRQTKGRGSAPPPTWWNSSNSSSSVTLVSRLPTKRVRSASAAAAPISAAPPPPKAEGSSPTHPLRAPQTRVLALPGVTDVNVNHARSRRRRRALTECACARGERSLKARGCQYGGRCGRPPCPRRAGLTRGAAQGLPGPRDPRQTQRAAFEDGPKRRVPVRRRPREPGGLPRRPRRPQPVGLRVGDGLWRQRARGRARGGPPGAASSAGGEARRPGREPAGGRLEPRALREGKGPRGAEPKPPGEIRPVPGARPEARPAAERPAAAAGRGRAPLAAREPARPA